MKFQKFTRGGLEYRIYADDCGGQYPIHGAVRLDSGSDVWRVLQWSDKGELIAGESHDYDLLPEKKRRFKTAEELIACGFYKVGFWGDGDILINTKDPCCSDNMVFSRNIHTVNDLYDVHSPDWLDIFTVEEE